MNAAAMADKEGCPICYDPDVHVRIDACRHCFCQQCTDRLCLEETPLCPMCRTPIQRTADWFPRDVLVRALDIVILLFILATFWACYSEGHYMSELALVRTLRANTYRRDYLISPYHQDLLRIQSTLGAAVSPFLVVARWFIGAAIAAWNAESFSDPVFDTCQSVGHWRTPLWTESLVYYANRGCDLTPADDDHLFVRLGNATHLRTELCAAYWNHVFILMQLAGLLIARLLQWLILKRSRRYAYTVISVE